MGNKCPLVNFPQTLEIIERRDLFIVDEKRETTFGDGFSLSLVKRKEDKQDRGGGVSVEGGGPGRWAYEGPRSLGTCRGAPILGYPGRPPAPPLQPS